MTDIISSMLSEREQAEFHEYITFIHTKMDSEDTLEALTVANTPGSHGLLLVTNSKLSFLIGKDYIAEAYKILYKDVGMARVNGLRLTVKKRRGLFKNENFDLISESPRRFINALSKHIDVQFSEEQMQIAIRKQSENSIKLEKIRNESIIFDGRLAGRDVRSLPDVLESDESVYAVVSGMYERRIGIIAVTDKRVIFVNKGMINLTVEVIYFKNLSALRYHKGTILGEIILYTHGSRERISSISNRHVQPLVDLIQHQIEKSQTQSQIIAPIQVNLSTSVSDEIMKLAELRNQSIISDEEFTQMKANVIQSQG